MLNDFGMFRFPLRLILKKIFRFVCLPWWIILLPKRRGASPYFGPPTPPYGGPDLKARKLKAIFGNSYWPSCIYVFSGKPISSIFLRFVKWRKIPIILNQDGVYYPQWYPRGFKEMNLRLRLLHCLSDFVIYQSQFCVRSCEVWIKPPPRKQTILYNAVDTHYFCPQNRTATAPIRVLAASYFNPSNSYVLEHILKMTSHLNRYQPTMQLLIAGQVHGSDKDRLPDWVVSLVRETETEPYVTYLGAYDQKSAPSIYNQAHIFVHLKHMDPCPSTVLEAMACGLPVIYGATGGTPELVQEGGIGIPVDSSYDRTHLPEIEPLAQAVGEIEKSWRHFSLQARKRVENHFSLDPWYQQHRHIFLDLQSNVGEN